MRLRLYHYWRSSSSWRVRWALALKALECEYVPISLLNGESESPEFLAVNPLGYVPVLEFLDSGPRFPRLFQSLAIVEWLDETHPTPPLLGKDTFERAHIRQLAGIINADTQPLGNLSVGLHHSPDPEEQRKWNQHWIRRGLGAYETIVRETAGKYSFGDQLTLADLFLIPQCMNAVRQEVPLTEFPIVNRINDAALQTEACRNSSPDRFKPQES